MQMQTKRMLLRDIRPAAYNPRKRLEPGEKEYEALKGSIERWGLVDPLVVNARTGNLISGHQRYYILTNLGETETEAVVVDLDERQEKLLNVAMNKVEGQWDYGKLETLLSEFETDEILFTGFSEGEIATLFGEEVDDVVEEYEEVDTSDEEDEDDGGSDEDGEFSIYLSFPDREVALEPGDPEFERLKNSIETFGEVAPIVWNQRTGRIVGGHQRLAVYKHLGRQTATVSVVDLDEKEEKLLNVALNKIKGQWDYSKLEQLLGDYEIEEAKATGFSAQEIALILARNDDLEDDAEDYDDEPGDYVGASWVITLAFEHASDARTWAEENGHSGAVKKGASTTVIRMD